MILLDRGLVKFRLSAICCCFYASAAENLRFGCVRPWVILWVSGSTSLCVPINLGTPYFDNQWREFHPNLVTDVFGS